MQGMPVRLTVVRSESGWIVARDGTSLVRFDGPRAEEMALRHHRELTALLGADAAAPRRIPVTAVMSEYVKKTVQALFGRRRGRRSPVR